MPRCQIGSRLAQAVGIDRAAVEFDIEMACHAAERLVVVASYPHGVLHRGERKRVVRCGGSCHGLRIDRFRSVSLGPGNQQRPRLDRRGGGQRGKVDSDTAATPSPRERHHPNRIETLADEVAVGVDGIGADAEQFGDVRADSVWAAQDGSPNPTSFHSNPSYWLGETGSGGLLCGGLPYFWVLLLLGVPTTYHPRL